MRKPPQYPIEGRRLDLQGQTMVMFLVTAQGVPSEPSVLRPSGHPILDHAALAHLHACIAQFGSGASEPLPPARYVLPMLWRLE
jgi:TonB family protein